MDDLQKEFSRHSFASVSAPFNTPTAKLVEEQVAMETPSTERFIIRPANTNDEGSGAPLLESIL